MAKENRISQPSNVIITIPRYGPNPQVIFVYVSLLITSSWTFLFFVKFEFEVYSKTGNSNLSWFVLLDSDLVFQHWKSFLPLNSSLNLSSANRVT